MPAPDPPLTVTVAQDAGGTELQDHVEVLPDAVVLLDGASGFETDGRNGGWYARALGAELRATIEAVEGRPLADLVADAIAAVSTTEELDPATAPSSTVVVLRWSASTVESFVLGDSTLVVFLADGSHEAITDDRLAHLAEHERHAYRQRLAEGHGYDDAHRRILADLTVEERRHRNRGDGYWIASTDPEAAHHAIVRSWDRADVVAALAAHGRRRRHPRSLPPGARLGAGPRARPGRRTIGRHRCGASGRAIRPDRPALAPLEAPRRRHLRARPVRTVRRDGLTRSPAGARRGSDL